MNVVRTLLLLLALLAITLTLLLAGATGLGALLHRLMPSVELGTAVLIGVVALSVCARFALGLLGGVHSLEEELDEAELEELVAVVSQPPRKQRSRRR
jgi:hypothetical protein